MDPKSTVLLFWLLYLLNLYFSLSQFFVTRIALRPCEKGGCLKSRKYKIQLRMNNRKQAKISNFTYNLMYMSNVRQTMEEQRIKAILTCIKSMIAMEMTSGSVC